MMPTSLHERLSGLSAQSLQELVERLLAVDKDFVVDISPSKDVCVITHPALDQQYGLLLSDGLQTELDKSTVGVALHRFAISRKVSTLSPDQIKNEHSARWKRINLPKH